MKKRKILFVNGHMRYGGVERSLLDVLRNINYEKFKVDLLLIEGKGEYYQNIPPQVNVIFKDINNAYGSFFGSIVKSLKKGDLLSVFTRLVFLGRKLTHPYLLRLLRMPFLGNITYDFAVAYRYGICTDIVLYTANARKKTTWWHHGEMNLSDHQLLEYEKACIQLKNIVVISEPCKNMLSVALPSISKFITIIPNMIDGKIINLMAAEFSPNYDLDKKHFVTACRFAPEKHIDNIIYASEILLQRGFSNFQWHIIGDGDEDDFKILKDLSEDRKTTKQVIFEGKKSNPYPYLKSADLYIHPSYVESQGLSILEAMTLNTPCIITDNTGIRDYATIDNSVVVKQGAEPLADAIFELVNNSEKNNTLKLNTQCPNQFTSENIISKIEKFLS